MADTYGCAGRANLADGFQVLETFLNVKNNDDPIGPSGIACSRGRIIAKYSLGNDRENVCPRDMYILFSFQFPPFSRFGSPRSANLNSSTQKIIAPLDSYSRERICIT